jgi:hypothetical protein
MARDPDKPSLSDRFTRAVLRADSTEPTGDEGPVTVDEIELAIARADDKERLIGLIAAPLAGAIGLLVAQSMAAHGTTKAASSTSQLLAVSLLVLAAVMLASAWWRKRLYLGIAMALYGLSIFNLHFWGFGIPYLLFGSWYLVRAYRLQQKLKLAKGDGPTGGSDGPARRASPNKRYTPPVTGPAKPARPAKPDTDA